MAMDEAGVQQAWNMMSQHNDALMLRVAELEEQLRKQSIWTVIKFRFLCLMGRM
jgi:hypothetical protein